MYKKKYIYPICVLFCASLLIPGCKQDKEDISFQGVGKLIAERNEARLAQSADKKGLTKKKYVRKSSSVLKDESSTEEAIFEKKVKIISSSSGKTLAKATAFLDENGKIINIKIDRE